MNFTQVARKSFQTIWKHKSLWLFGFFFAAGSGAGARTTLPQHKGGLVSTEPSAVPSWVWPVIGVGMVLGFLALLIHVMSEAALIDGATQANREEAPTIGSGFRSGRRHFWRVLGVKLLGGLGLLVGILMGPRGVGGFVNDLFDNRARAKRKAARASGRNGTGGGAAPPRPEGKVPATAGSGQK